MEYLNTSIVPYRDELLYIIATGIRLDRETILKFNTTAEAYTRKILSDLYKDKLVSGRSYKEGILKLSEKGLQYIKGQNTDLYNYYNRYTYNNRPGGSAKHIEGHLKSSQLIYLMLRASVLTGIQKPPIEDDINIGARPKKLSPSQPAFYMIKELTFSTEQKKQRAQLSRSNGAILSRGITGLVYRPTSPDMRISRMSEMENNIRLRQFVKKVYDEVPKEMANITDSLIVGDSYDFALEMLKSVTSEKNTRVTKTIGDAISNRKLTETNFKYIPLTMQGAELLYYLTRLTDAEVKSKVFAPEEINVAQNEHPKCDAVIKQMRCYEFITSNLTKLSYIKKNIPDDESIGIVCWEPQIEFIKSYLSCNLKFRAFKTESLGALFGKD